MRANDAVERLKELLVEVETPSIFYSNEQGFTSWKQRVRAVIANSLGGKHELLEKFDKNSYSLGFWTTSTPDSAFKDSHAEGVRRARGYIEAAIYELELLSDSDEPVDEHSFDMELWDHVRTLIEAEEWEKVAANVAIFVEDKTRRWSEQPDDLVGKGLYAKVLADESELRLGDRKGEYEGWRALGMGLAQAIGNVDRHRRQSRADARRYAIGVLGLGSLLLTQMRYEHGDLIEERD